MIEMNSLKRDTSMGSSFSIFIMSPFKEQRFSFKSRFLFGRVLFNRKASERQKLFPFVKIVETPGGIGILFNSLSTIFLGL